MAEMFEPLKVVKRQIQDVNQSRYRVYKSGDEFVTVDAATALEAIQESGMANPVKVERVLQFQDRLLDQQRLRPEKDEIAFPTGEEEAAGFAHTQVRAEKEADKTTGFSELPFRQGDAQSVINPQAEQEGFVPFAATEEMTEEMTEEAMEEQPEEATPIAISGDVMEPEVPEIKPQPQREEPQAETLSEDDVAALLQEKPE